MNKWDGAAFDRWLTTEPETHDYDSWVEEMIEYLDEEVWKWCDDKDVFVKWCNKLYLKCTPEKGAAIINRLYYML